MTEIPTQISFRNMDKPMGVEDRIHQKVAALERHHPRITWCRVTIERRHHSHRTAAANNFHVSIAAAVPGAELVVEHEAPQHADLAAAINGAFDEIRRRMEDHGQRQRTPAEH